MKRQQGSVMAAASPNPTHHLTPVDVEARLNYLAPGEGPVEVRAYPPSSGRMTLRPALKPERVKIRDARAFAHAASLDEQGFELHAARTSFVDYYDSKLVQAYYYSEVSNVMRELTGALTV